MATLILGATTVSMHSATEGPVDSAAEIAARGDELMRRIISSAGLLGVRLDLDTRKAAVELLSRTTEGVAVRVTLTIAVKEL